MRHLWALADPVCWRARLPPLFWIPYINCADLVKLTPESSLRSAPAGSDVPVWSCFFRGCVFSLAQESPEKSQKLCSRWTESDRGRERCTEALDNAAGQWGRQKLIREAAFFTTPQLDHVCVCLRVRVCRQHVRWPWHQLKGVFVGLRVYLPAWDIAHSLFSPPFGSLAQINRTLISISEQTTSTEHAVGFLRSWRRLSRKGDFFWIMNSWGSGEYSWMVPDSDKDRVVCSTLAPPFNSLNLHYLIAILAGSCMRMCVFFMCDFTSVCHLNMADGTVISCRVQQYICLFIGY